MPDFNYQLSGLAASTAETTIGVTISVIATAVRTFSWTIMMIAGRLSCLVSRNAPFMVASLGIKWVHSHTAGGGACELSSLLFNVAGSTLNLNPKPPILRTKP